MAPKLFSLQLEHGAWGITAATVWQAQVMVAAGIRRIVLANEVVTRPEISALAGILNDHPEIDFYCFVDSLAGVAALDGELARVGVRRQLRVLIELGIPGGRTGARSFEEAMQVASAAARARTQVVAGVAGYEGIIKPKAGKSVAPRIREFLAQLSELTLELDAAGRFGEVGRPIVTAGGSSYFDYVVEALGDLQLGHGRRLAKVVRSGCYLTHADGGYDASSPMGREPRVDAAYGRLIPAMEVWGAVLSRPEPSRAIVGVGRRDISHDGDLPIVRAYRSGSGAIRRSSGVVADMNDQHTYIDIDIEDPVQVGDLVSLGVRHPCTTFDKWRAIPLVDDEYRILDIIHTYF